MTWEQCQTDVEISTSNSSWNTDLKATSGFGWTVDVENLTKKQLFFDVEIGR